MTRLLFVAVLIATLAACGKLGGNRAPGPPDQITYPKPYPTP